LTEEQRKIGRRDFLKAAAALPAVGAFAFSAKKMGPVRCAIIGSGSEGRVLMDQMNHIPDFIQMVGVCDIYPNNREQGLDLARTHNPDAKDYGDDYKRVLDDSSVEAVIIATPLWMHGPMAVDALKAGKHVFTEKTMAYSVEICDEMVRLADRNHLQLQVGHQRTYNPIYRQAVAMIKEGMLGDVYHIRAQWHRNGDWRSDMRWDIDETFDPSKWGYKDMEHLVNWRLYKKYSHGIMTELASHQLQIVNWIADATPVAVQGSSGIYRYHDGREWADHAYAIFEYPKGLTLMYSSIFSNQYDRYYELIMGTKGTLLLTSETQAMLFPEPGVESIAAKKTEMKVTKDEGGAAMEASASRAADATGTSVAGAQAAGGGKVSPLLAYRTELQGFAHSIRTGEPNLCSGRIGRDVALAALKANEAMAAGKRIKVS